MESGAQITQPVFTAYQLASKVRLAEARRSEAVTRYEKTIQTAFREASDALAAHQRIQESRTDQELLVKALQDRLWLAYVR